MLNLFRRHLKSCIHRPKSRKWRTCGCPLMIEGTLRGVLIRRSLDMRSWEGGQALVREWETNGAGAELVSPKEARDRLLKDAEARNLAAATIGKYKVLLRALVAYTEKKGISWIKAMTVQNVREFRASWPDGPLAGQKKLFDWRDTQIEARTLARFGFHEDRTATTAQ
jgi:hypothetical protein